MTIPILWNKTQQPFLPYTNLAINSTIYEKPSIINSFCKTSDFLWENFNVIYKSANSLVFNEPSLQVSAIDGVTQKCSSASILGTSALDIDGEIIDKVEDIPFCELISIDCNSELVVVLDQNKLFAFDNEGNDKWSFGGFGGINNKYRFNFPKKVSIGDDVIAVADSGNGAIKLYNYCGGWRNTYQIKDVEKVVVNGGEIWVSTSNKIGKIENGVVNYIYENSAITIKDFEIKDNFIYILIDSKVFKITSDNGVVVWELDSSSDFIYVGTNQLCISEGDFSDPFEPLTILNSDFQFSALEQPNISRESIVSNKSYDKFFNDWVELLDTFVSSISGKFISAVSTIEQPLTHSVSAINPLSGIDCDNTCWIGRNEVISYQVLARPIKILFEKLEFALSLTMRCFTTFSEDTVCHTWESLTCGGPSRIDDSVPLSWIELEKLSCNWLPLTACCECPDYCTWEDFTCDDGDTWRKTWRETCFCPCSSTWDSLSSV